MSMPVNLHAHAMVALVAQKDAERLYRPYDGSWPSMDDCLEAERLYDVAFEADAQTTREAFKDVARWLCGQGELPKKEGKAA